MEYLDIVNDNDEVIGQCTVSESYNKLLPHRISHILIFNDAGKMLLQKRTAEEKFCPNHWSSAVGGHVQAGESYEEAALREYEEELGTKSEIEFIGKVLYDIPNTPNKFLTIFKSDFNGPYNINLDEVAAIDSFSIEEIKNMIKNGEKFLPELLFILEKYYL